jgi:fumarate reductase subunit D
MGGIPVRLPASDQPARWAALVNRVSGVLLSLFLPVHFWAMGQALEGAERLDAFLAWTQQPAVHAAEIGLVVLLTAHFTGGLRLLALEFLDWSAVGPWHKDLIALAAGASLGFGLLFALNIL